MRALSPLLALSALALVSLAGCGGDTARVAGTVTLDGQPLQNAQVVFTPVEANADAQRPSSGVTDSAGKYELNYTFDEQGATIGKHRVEIRTTQAGEGAQGKERLPKKYNAESELTAQVSSGSNTLDFDLTSK